MSAPVDPVLAELEREHAAFAATADRAIASAQAQAHSYEQQLRATEAALAAAREEIAQIHHAGHIPPESGHRLSRLLYRAARRSRTAGL
ncbi:MAG: hypothetical protein Q7T55_01025 [Solirubrobacteraceae bacterium]|nr:hypothetical protein [Solirubrobacteraceae bacterium]